MNRKPRDKHIKNSLIAGALALGLMLSACGANGGSDLKNNRQLLADLDVKAVEEDVLAVVINQPTEDESQAFKGLSSINYQPEGEKMLFVPLAAGSSMRVEEITWDEARQELVPGLSIFRIDSTAEGDALLLTAYRAEGVPALRVLVRSGDQAAQYLIDYNGQTGTPDVEYITPSAEGLEAWNSQSQAGNAGQETEENAAEAGQSEETVPGAASAEGALTLNEISTVFNMNEADIIERYGQPKERTTEALFEGANALNLIYGFSRFSLDNEENGFVYAAVLSDDLVEAPRGVRIGDSLETLIAKFPNQGDGTIKEDPMEAGHGYQLLYGANEYMTEHGVIEYLNQVPVSVTYGTQEGAIVAFELENGQVARVRYEMALT